MKTNKSKTVSSLAEKADQEWKLEYEGKQWNRKLIVHFLSLRGGSHWNQQILWIQLKANIKKKMKKDITWV